MQYNHTQNAPLYLILVGVGIAMFISGWLVPEQIVQIILLSSGGLMFVLAQCFGRLTVSDENDRIIRNHLCRYPGRGAHGDVVGKAQRRNDPRT